MSTSQKSANRSKHKQVKNKKEKNSWGMMRIFSVFMLLLMLSGGLIRFAGASQRSTQATSTPDPQTAPVGVGGTAARVLVFRREQSGTGTCEDLTIPARGSAVYSNCGKGMEKQYNLNPAEQAKLQTWREQFQPVNYDHTEQTQAGGVITKLYLNGAGNQRADVAETQQMIDFAASLAKKIALQR